MERWGNGCVCKIKIALCGLGRGVTGTFFPFAGDFFSFFLFSVLMKF